MKEFMALITLSQDFRFSLDVVDVTTSWTTVMIFKAKCKPEKIKWLQLSNLGIELNYGSLSP